MCLRQFEPLFGISVVYNIKMSAVPLCLSTKGHQDLSLLRLNVLIIVFISKNLITRHSYAILRHQCLSNECVVT